MKPAGYGKRPPPLSLGPSCAAPPSGNSGRSLVRSVSDRKAFGPGDQPNSAALPTWGYDFDPEVATRAVAAKARLLEGQSGVVSAPAPSASSAAQALCLAHMAAEFAGPTEPRRGRVVQLPPVCWADLERLIEKFQQFSRHFAQSARQPSEGNARALAACAGLGCEVLSARRQDPDRVQLGHLAVDTIIGHLAVMSHRLGGAVMPAAIYFRFRKAWLEGLQAMEAMQLAPVVSTRINLAPLVQSLGGQDAPMELLFSLMDLSAAHPSLSDGLRRGVASGVLAARYAGGASASADQAVLDWLLCDLASRACPSLLFTALPQERSFQVLQGSLDAFLRVGASPLARLRRVMVHLTKANRDQFQGAIARCLSAAIDGCGHALPAATLPAARMHAIASALLQAWAERQEPAPYQMMAQLIISLGNCEAITWLPGAVGAGGHWDAAHAARLIVNCIEDLETSEHRQAARRAIDHQMRSAAGVQTLVPIAQEPPSHHQLAEDLAASQRGGGVARQAMLGSGPLVIERESASSRTGGTPSTKLKALGE